MVSVLFMLAVLLSLIAAYFTTTNLDIATTKSSQDSSTGFYVAEAGLNLRAEDVRQRFVGYNRPSGASPTDTSSSPCVGANQGSGDFVCREYSLSNRQAVTYIKETPGNPLILTIPLGERYQNLNAQEYRYSATSFSLGPNNHTEAVLELRFKSRLVPLFQFAAFYDKDLEILPGPNMLLQGPVHTNGDLYLNSYNTLQIKGQVTVAGSLYRGRKSNDECSGTVNIWNSSVNPAAYRRLGPSSCSTRIGAFSLSDVRPWGTNIQLDVPPVTVPSPEEFDPIASKTYWSKAELRLVLPLDSANAVISSADAPNGVVQVANPDESINSALTTLLNRKVNCPGRLYETAANANNGWVVSTKTFWDFRERATIRVLDVDMRGLLACLANFSQLIGGKALNEDSEGGLVFHFTVKGPNSAARPSRYAVRIKNADNLRASSLALGAPTPKGISIISDQPVYIMGSFNSNAAHVSTNASGYLPAAIMADAINILSTNWLDTYTSATALTSRPTTATTINAAFLAGTDVTGGSEGVAGQNSGMTTYNGGLENYPRFHENWSGVTLNYRGSFVSLGTPRHANGPWRDTGSTNNVYNPPTRNWYYESYFNDATYLPPITPRFVYLRQELFVRDYERR